MKKNESMWISAEKAFEAAYNAADSYVKEEIEEIYLSLWRGMPVAEFFAAQRKLQKLETRVQTALEGGSVEFREELLHALQQCLEEIKPMRLKTVDGFNVVQAL